VCRLLSDPCTLRSLDWVHEQLAQAVEEPLLREASARLWFLRQGLAQAEGPKRVALSQLVVMEQVLCQRLSPQWQQAYTCVAQLLEHVVRASSAVEGLDSVMRMHQARQRHVSQGMLDLKRLYWNCRVFGHAHRALSLRIAWTQAAHL